VPKSKQNKKKRGKGDEKGHKSPSRKGRGLSQKTLTIGLVTKKKKKNPRWDVRKRGQGFSREEEGRGRGVVYLEEEAEQ